MKRGRSIKEIWLRAKGNRPPSDSASRGQHRRASTFDAGGSRQHEHMGSDGDRRPWLFARTMRRSAGRGIGTAQRCGYSSPGSPTARLVKSCCRAVAGYGSRGCRTARGPVKDSSALKDGGSFVMRTSNSGRREPRPAGGSDRRDRCRPPAPHPQPRLSPIPCSCSVLRTATGRSPRPWREPPARPD